MTSSMRDSHRFWNSRAPWNVTKGAARSGAEGASLATALTTSIGLVRELIAATTGTIVVVGATVGSVAIKGSTTGAATGRIGVATGTGSGGTTTGVGTTGDVITIGAGTGAGTPGGV